MRSAKPGNHFKGHFKQLHTFGFWRRKKYYLFINHVSVVKLSDIFCECRNNNRLLTEREGRTGEYCPEVVAVRTERSEVRTATNEGQYSPVQVERARLVSFLLYGTRLLIVKCTSGGFRDVFVMTRATQTKASYHEFEKQIHWMWNRLKLA